jgi:putative ABC transport system substrate-binding protein
VGDELASQSVELFVIPIAFGLTSDPLSTGVVVSLARPGGNITRPFAHGGDLSAKRLELLQCAVPSLKRIAVLRDRSNPGVAV